MIFLSLILPYYENLEYTNILNSIYLDVKKNNEKYLNSDQIIKIDKINLKKTDHILVFKLKNKIFFNENDYVGLNKRLKLIQIKLNNNVLNYYFNLK